MSDKMPDSKSATIGAIRTWEEQDCKFQELFSTLAEALLLYEKGNNEGKLRKIESDHYIKKEKSL